MEKQLQTEPEGVKLSVKDGWLACPVCRRNKRLLRVGPDTQAQELLVYCRDCKTEILLNITKGRSVERRSQ